ncbi:MAG: hypothetical protein WC007_08440 [Pelobacteraceae bacterium]
MQPAGTKLQLLLLGTDWLQQVKSTNFGFFVSSGSCALQHLWLYSCRDYAVPSAQHTDFSRGAYFQVHGIDAALQIESWVYASYVNVTPIGYKVKPVPLQILLLIQE